MREQRKVVTVLFADVVGSTSMASDADPEVVRATMSRYFAHVTEVASAHGGTVEKFAGDAAMVLFGVPAAHDDDAERAVRAAIEIRERARGLAVRIGVNTGEAVTALTEDRQQMVSGDTVNVAARLQQGADAGEIVVGVLTERLTRSAIEYSPREPVVAKGKAEPLVAFRAVKPMTHMPSQVRGVPGLHSSLVGRDRELRLLLDTYARVAAERRLHLFTVIGTPGVGKTRLVEEALADVAGSGGRLLRGRVLPYGHGITYWPLIEIVRQDTGIGLGDDRATALSKLDRWLGELLPGNSDLPALRARLSVMMGLEQPSAVMPDTPADRVHKEISWAVRRYVEALARSAPLVIVIDDAQWAETPMLEILEQLADRLADVPVMLVCIARPEFLEARSGWGAGKANTSTISLAPLSGAETATLISQLLEVEALPAALRAQIVERSAGTPLFCEELIRMLVDDGRLVREGARWRVTAELDQVPVPPSINAVLSTRLDGLPEGDRAVLQAASVIGERFTAPQVTALFGGAEVDGYLESLRRKGLISGDDRPDSELRFSHLLVRDAAYGSLTKSERASLHDRFGGVLASQVEDPHQISEILAHHAERAFSLSVELGLNREAMHGRANRALELSLDLADRAVERSDKALLDGLLAVAGQAAAALDGMANRESEARLALLEASRAVLVADYPTAARHSAAAASIAEAAGLRKLVAAARLNEAWIQNWSLAGDLADFDLAVRRAVEACMNAEDVEGAIEARFVGANSLWSLGQVDEFIATLSALASEARAIGDRRHLAAILMRLSTALHVSGETEAAVVDKRTEAEAIVKELGLRDLALRGAFQAAVGTWYAGDVASSERMLRQYLADALESGARQLVLLGMRFFAVYLLEARRFGEAAQLLDSALEMSEATGDRWNRAELFAYRTEAAAGAGDLAAGERFMAQALAMMRDDDLSAVFWVYRGLGLLRLAQGRDDEAATALRKAHEIASATGFTMDRMIAKLTLARFLAGHGEGAEARRLVGEARRYVARAGWHYWEPYIEEIESATSKGTEWAEEVGR